MAHLPLIDKRVQDMLHHDIIEPAASPWCSNIVLIRKRDNSLRFCIDYCRANDLVVKNRFPLARVNSCLEVQGGSKYFFPCDLRQGYWQTLIAEQGRDKTVFIARKGQGRFKVLSFGPSNAPS
jgi:hypothetical protein